MKTRFNRYGLVALLLTLAALTPAAMALNSCCPGPCCGAGQSCCG